MRDQELNNGIFFSVIIPTYNRPEMLERALKSVLNQSFSNYEIIMINDGSSVSYAEIIKTYNDKVNILHNEVSQGVALARNTAIKSSLGKWIVFLDDDDEFHPDFLENLYNRLKNASPEVGFSWSSILHKTYNNKDEPPTEHFNYFEAEYRTEGQLHAQATTIGCGFGLSIKKECFDKVGGFDTSFKVCEDTDLILNLLSYGYKPLVCTNIGVIVHHHMQQRLTPNFNEHAITGVYERLFEKHKEYIAKYPEVLSRFLGWTATVYYMAGMSKKGNSILRQMVGLNRYNHLVWRQFFLINYRRLFIKRN